MIRSCNQADFESILAVINDGAKAYKGIIPADRWTDPYMSRKHLRCQIEEGVLFSGYEENGELLAVMGLQHVQDVTLIRHAYVRIASQQRGIGTLLLGHLLRLTASPVLVGTWADATWAIRFYRKHGFQTVTRQEKDRLLRKYWIIPERQVQTSVVLANAEWRAVNTCSKSRREPPDTYPAL